MSLTNNPFFMASTGAAGFYDFPIEQSLRFNQGDSAYLSRTPATAGNQKTFTISAWVKRTELPASYLKGRILTCGTSLGSNLSNSFFFGFDGDESLRVYQEIGGATSISIDTNAVYRDVSAWLNVICSVDTTQATASDRLKLYVNGEQITSLASSTYPSLNTDCWVNDNSAHWIGRSQGNEYSSFYLAEYNLIDGQALDPTSFGEFKSGIWIPKDTADLTFGNNGFRLQFGDTTEASGFNTVTYTGNGGTQSISGVGFSSAPDFVWIKNRSGVYDHKLLDSVRGATKILASNLTSAEATEASGLTSFDADGFTVGSQAAYNGSGNNMVAWCWDAGSGSPASNTDGSITSTVKANTEYGFSIATFTGTGANATIGHGLGQTPDAVIVKQRSAAGNHWVVWTNALSGTQFLYLDSTGTTNTNANIWNSTTPTSSVFSVGSDAQTNGSGNNLVAYCFAEKAGYSKIGSYVGNGSASGPSITGLGFKPAFLLVKSSTAAEGWQILDNTREVTPDEKQDILTANTSNAEATISGNVEFTDDGFNVNTNIGNFNLSGQTYIYMAFADTRNAAFWKDTSGQGNDWQPNNLVFSDVVPDGTNNFCTYNPNSRFDGNGTFSEGNLRFSGNSSGDMSTRTSTVIPAGMKFYFEAIYNEQGGSGGQARLGIDQTGSTADREKSGTGLFSFDFRGSAGTPQADDEGTLTTYGSQPAEGDVVGIAVDLENGKLYAHKANSYYNSGDPAAGTGAVITGIPDLQSVVFMALDGGVNYNSWHINFGQDSTFAGRKAAGGNADENGYGDFAYAPPSGFLSLCSANLPSGAINTLNDETPEDYFNTVLYTGDGIGQSITGVGFQPDWTWIKCRSAASSHSVYDVNRGVYKALLTDSTSAELNLTGAVTSFTSDGFTLGTEGLVNTSGRTYVGWNWKAGGSGVSNTDGSITSTVSVGATSQQNWFSVVGYSGNSVAGATVGHGLGVQPDMIIVKSRTATSGYLNWGVYHKDLGATKVIYLNTTGAESTAVGAWNNTAPTLSVFSLGNDSGFGFGISGQDYIAYCFANAEGLCKVGSYTGNGSTDGVFVYTGHRPKYVILKRTDSTGGWNIIDAERSPINPNDKRLEAQGSGAESTNSAYNLDFLSNGFKLRTTNVEWNASGGSYIFLSISEQPFAFANAR